MSASTHHSQRCACYSRVCSEMVQSKCSKDKPYSKTCTSFLALVSCTKFCFCLENICHNVWAVSANDSDEKDDAKDISDGNDSLKE